jgi:hypothetical protein
VTLAGRSWRIRLFLLGLAIAPGLGCADGEPDSGFDGGPPGGPTGLPPGEAPPAPASPLPGPSLAPAHVQVGVALPPALSLDADAEGPLLLEIETEVPSDRPLQALLRWSASAPVSAQVTLAGPGVQRTLPPTPHTRFDEIEIVELRSNARYDVEVVATAEDGERVVARGDFQTGTLALETSMQWSVVVDDIRREPGITLMALAGGQFPEYVAVDHEGYVVWHYVDRTGRASGLGNIIRRLPDGTLLLRGATDMRVVDTWGRTLRRYPESSALGLPFHHDAVFVPDGNLLVLSAERRQIFAFELGGNVNVLADTVLELDTTGGLVRRWHAFDALDGSRFPGPMSRQDLGIGFDWSHTNAIHYRAADDSYLVSVRNQSWVVNVDRTTGDVIWTFGADGDFELLEGTWFNGQHTPSWLGDQIVIYDNGNEKMPQASRVVVYDLDLRNFTAREAWSWNVPFFTPAVGDVDRLSATWLITAGVSRNNAAPPTLFEIDDNGTTVWQLEASGGVIYRAERIPRLWAP